MKGYGRDQNMKAYGKKLWWIENQHYGDELHTGIPPPSSGKSVGSVERDMKESLRRWKDSTVKMKSEK